jgi:hypothetical protein
MARTAGTQLQQQLAEVRREGFAAGYTAAMMAVRKVASRSAPKAGSAAITPQGRGRARSAVPRPRSTGPRRARATGGTARTRRSAAERSPRGTNARAIWEILKASAPRAMRPAEIRKALQDKGVGMAFASIGHALGQLETRSAAEKIGDSKTWRHSGTSA